MSELFATGRIVDLLLLFLAAEVLALAVWRVRRGGGVPLGELLALGGAGAALLVALRLALTGVAWPAIAAALAVAGLLQGLLLVLRARA